ncbi:SPOR domain-containing protein [Dechloromonas sp. XY25]|uniref:SPOR domain-containing protein n=1 Tax=Dechloromonas hankyongensis TaxID=2908002 RepID=A0ABS9JZ48_9RHOO|nr:SPOR domain-containing protein [Dechloromonas hankyongensis]
MPPPRAAAPVEPAPSKPAGRLSPEPRPAAPVQPPSSVARLFSGFILQAGVFSSAQRAEELHAKLTLSGVPSTLETRVQVGPFRTKQEAEAAQAKLRELGVETILVPPKGKN